MPPEQIININCNHCGAVLQVDEKTRFVTCSSCQSQLVIQRSGAAVFTEVLEKAAPKTSEAAMDPAPAKAAQLAGKLKSSVENFTSNTGTGRPRKPSALAGVASILLGILVGGMMIGLVRNGAPSFFLLFGLVFFCAGVYNGFKAIGLAMNQRK